MADGWPASMARIVVANIAKSYRKVHLAMDRATGDIRAVGFTPGREGDSPVLPDLPARIPPDEETGTVTGDGACDTRRCHTAIPDRGGTAIMPVRRNGRLWKEGCPAARARPEPATISCAQPGAWVAPRGSNGPVIMSEAGSGV